MLGIVLAVLGMALFLRLGFWQLDRADQKQALLDQYQIGQQSQVEITSSNADRLARYQRVRVTGRYDPAHQILLDNMPSHSGQPGYRVLTPLQTSVGWVLVDRGWLPLGRSREQLPDIGVTPDERTITGTMDALPRAGLQLETPLIDPNTPWPRVLSFPTQAALEQQLGHELLPGLLLLDASQPDGYQRVWEAHLGFKPERHVGYAVQWFALAAAALILFLVISVRTKKATDESPRCPQGAAGAFPPPDLDPDRRVLRTAGARLHSLLRPGHSPAWKHQQRRPDSSAGDLARSRAAGHGGSNAWPRGAARQMEHGLYRKHSRMLPRRARWDAFIWSIRSAT
jgi:surfeit locus 1 family protein